MENSSASSAIECSPGPVELEQDNPLGGTELGGFTFESAFRAGDRHSFAGAHSQQVHLELGERGEDVEEAFAHGVAGVKDRAADKRTPGAASERS
jgi:hypothetical protein